VGFIDGGVGFIIGGSVGGVWIIGVGFYSVIFGFVIAAFL
jgi:hypothetical protein